MAQKKGVGEDALHEDKKIKIQSVAGPDVTDQIGHAVHAAAMAGGEPNPEQNRGIIGENTPKSFRPFEEPSSASESVGDVAVKEFKAKGEALDKKLAAPALDEAARKEKIAEIHADTPEGKAEKAKVTPEKSEAAAKAVKDILDAEKK